MVHKHNMWYKQNRSCATEHQRDEWVVPLIWKHNESKVCKESSVVLSPGAYSTQTHISSHGGCVRDLRILENKERDNWKFKNKACIPNYKRSLIVLFSHKLISFESVMIKLCAICFSTKDNRKTKAKQSTGPIKVIPKPSNIALGG